MGIAATIAHRRPHHGRAEEHFLPSGRLRSCHQRQPILAGVTEKPAEAERLLAGMPPPERELERARSSSRPVTVERPRLTCWSSASRGSSCGSMRRSATRHSIHPSPARAQSRPARCAALAEAVVDAARLGLDPGGADVLDRYQRWRRFDTLSMGIATDGLNRLFSNRSDALRAARDIGLGLVERLPAL
jgi:2-octaprenyl-6-methoxyphenol hydroxylase